MAPYDTSVRNNAIKERRERLEQERLKLLDIVEETLKKIQDKYSIAERYKIIDRIHKIILERQKSFKNMVEGIEGMAYQLHKKDSNHPIIENHLSINDLQILFLI